MKARIKESGQIIDVVFVENRFEIDGIHSYFVEKEKEYMSGRSLWKDTQLDFDIGNQSNFDWYFFRREAAKDILPVLIDKACEEYEFNTLNKEVYCEQAIEWAEELIRQLKQE